MFVSEFHQNVKGIVRRQAKIDDLEDEEMAVQKPRTRKSVKRKREEDSETAPPQKVSKGDRDGRSGRRKTEVPLEVPMRVSSPNKI
jgi:hypothetical protein